MRIRECEIRIQWKKVSQIHIMDDFVGVNLDVFGVILHFAFCWVRASGHSFLEWWDILVVEERGARFLGNCQKRKRWGHDKGSQAGKNDDGTSTDKACQNLGK